MPKDAARQQAQQGRSGSAGRRFQRYWTQLHLPLIIVVWLVTVVLGALGFALRPGTDRPPRVSSSNVNVGLDPPTRPNPSTGIPTFSSGALTVDEVLLQKTSSTVDLQLSLFGAFALSGPVQWEVATTSDQSGPYFCPSPYDYFGISVAQPVHQQDGELMLNGAVATSTVLGQFVGHVDRRSASGLAITGNSPGWAPAGTLRPLGQIDLCWHTRHAPLSFDGAYASAAIPSVTADSPGQLTGIHVNRILYFTNPRANNQPVTAQYNVQGGSLPNVTGPFGWRWTNNTSGDLIEMTAVNLSSSQHEAYRGFLSGVLFAIAGGGLILLLQELLGPLART